MSQPQSRLSSGSLGDTAAVAPDLDAGAATFTSLPRDLVATQILSRLPDPFDLAQLSLVSREMRDAVDATERKVEEFGEEDAAERGYLSTLKCLRRRYLKNERLLKPQRRWRPRGIFRAKTRVRGHVRGLRVAADVLKWARARTTGGVGRRARTPLGAATSTC